MIFCYLLTNFSNSYTNNQAKKINSRVYLSIVRYKKVSLILNFIFNFVIIKNQKLKINNCYLKYK